MTETFQPAAPIWCAGCGDYGVQAALDRGLDELGVARHDVVVVAGIGCSGTVQNTMHAYGYHSLHGRVLPAAIGVKLANPALTVVGVAGDGDALAIGAGHLLHAYRRNPAITYVIVNNGTYGLTKGQPSPTSPVGYRTQTSAALDPLLLGLAVPATTFLARGYTGDPAQLGRLMLAALHHAGRGQGLAVLEVISPCVTYLDTYGQWPARLVDVDADPGYDRTDRQAAFGRALQLQAEERLPSGLLFTAADAAPASDGSSPAAAVIDVAANRADYERVLASLEV